MESMGSPHHYNAYLRSIPCDLLLGDYVITVDNIDEFESGDDYCPSLVLHINAGVNSQLTTLPCPNAYGRPNRRDYIYYVTNVLIYWFSRLGFRPALVARLALEIGCFILHNAWSHRCSTRRHGRPAMSVPYISITHFSLVMEYWLNEGAMSRVKRATDESIKALEKVRCTDLDYDYNRNGLCVVCLEKLDLKVQEEVVRMQCSHVFHKDCIVEWLKNSHVCPLCRFEMPAIEV